MSSNDNHIAKLTKAPLQEVIFEAFWELDIDAQTRESFDPEFDLAQGIFGQIVQQKYPVYKRVTPPILPPHLLNYKPVHQFWHGERQWPVLQLGPGLLTTNDTEKTYIWETGFRLVIEYALEALLKSYKEPPRFHKVSLRYIDAFELGTEFKDNFVQFIERNLQIQINKRFEIDGIISDQSFSQAYSLEDGSKLNLVISNGSRNSKPAVIWQTVVVKEKKLSVDDISKWISIAHSITSNLFKRMLRKDFYDSLK